MSHVATFEVKLHPRDLVFLEIVRAIVWRRREERRQYRYPERLRVLSNEREDFGIRRQLIPKSVSLGASLADSRPSHQQRTSD
jgi:hypothetical protein